MNRILHRRDVRLALAGVSLESEVGQSLQMVGLLVCDDEESAVPIPRVYETLNGALEASENELLTILTERQRTTLSGHGHHGVSTSIGKC